MKRLFSDSRAVVGLVILLIAIASAMLDFYVPTMGDDLHHLHSLGMDDYRLLSRQTLSFMVGCYFGCNGRIFEFIGSLLVHAMPHALAAAFIGAMSALFFYSILAAAGLPRRRYNALSICLIALTVAIMPWWDGMWLHVCHFNYLWGATFCLLFIPLYYRKPSAATARPLAAIGLFILGVMAGAAHEQTGVAMCVAFFIQTVRYRRTERPGRRQIAMLGGLLFGTFLTVASPAIWQRAATGSVHQETTLLLLTTLPALLLLLSVLALMLLSPGGRRFLAAMAADRIWATCLLAATMSGLIAVASGFPGRTGLFSEACALVAATRMIIAADLHVRRPIAACAAALSLVFLTVHFAVAISEQKALYAEYEAVRIDYAQSPDGIIYQDFTGRYDGSPLTLRRVKGVPDADDFWYLAMLRLAYNPEAPRPVILPAGLRDRVDTLQTDLHLPGVSIYTHYPDSVVITADGVPLQHYPGPAPRYVSHAVTRSGRDIWVATERIRDPGDYELPDPQPLTESEYKELF